MPTNLLVGLKNLSELRNSDLNDVYTGSNRANQMGSALESYVKDLLCGSFDVATKEEKEDIYNQNFSYTSSQNNPPDLIIRNGDALEIKKIETIRSGIQLNSSYPKSKLYADSPMILPSCRSCEEWDVKDIIYTVGVVNKGKLKVLWFVYGDCYCAKKECYEEVKSPIVEGIRSIPNVELSPTKELGKLKKVDPLGITLLRIRGMWIIDNPIKVFSDIISYDSSKFNVIAIMQKEKYETFSQTDRDLIEGSSDYSIEDKIVVDPSDTSSNIEVKLIQAKF